MTDKTLTAEVKERYERLAQAIRETWLGQCKMLTLGSSCMCNLCNADVLREAAMRSLDAESMKVPKGMALVCATCRHPVPDDGVRYCETGDACPHRATATEGKEEV